MTSDQAQATASAGRTGWTTYDALNGPDLDPALWQPLNMGTGPLLEPDAVTTVADGVLTIDVPEFKNADADSQAFDNSKHVIFSTQGFSLPADGSAWFAVDLRADLVGGGSDDYRQGLVSFNIVDTTGGTGAVFNIFTTGARYFAEHETLAIPGQDNPFTRVVDDPFRLAQTAAAADGFRRCVVEIDRARGRAVWTIDGAVLHEAHGLTGLPDEVHIGIGIFTLLPVGQGDSSLRGQGAKGFWRGFEYRADGA